MDPLGFEPPSGRSREGPVSPGQALTCTNIEFGLEQTGIDVSADYYQPASA